MQRDDVLKILVDHQGELHRQFGKVDLVLRRAVLPERKEDIFAEAVDVF